SFAIHDGTRDWQVRKFLMICDATQHQPAATHVTATDKVCRKSQLLAKVGQQHVDVFPCGDAAEKNHFGLGGQFRCQIPRVALDWDSVTRIVLVDVDLGKFTQSIEMNSCSRINQAACRRDYKHT